MPYALNPVDGARIYYEDEGGPGPATVMFGGLLDSVHSVRDTALAQALDHLPGEFRLVFCDHRGLGNSDRPHDPAAYTMTTRVADAVAVLDDLGLDRAHFVGASWGGRLCFGIGEHAPERVRSIVASGQHPYAIDPDGPLTRVVVDASAAAVDQGIGTLVHAFELFNGARLDRAVRARYLDNDPMAVWCAFDSALTDGAVSRDLAAWRVPCLILAGAEDVDFHDQARRAAAEIPGAAFVSVGGADHLNAHLHQDSVVSTVLAFLRAHS